MAESRVFRSQNRKEGFMEIVGRNREIKDLSNRFENPDFNGMAIFGITGMGKRTLLKHCFDKPDRFVAAHVQLSRDEFNGSCLALINDLRRNYRQQGNNQKVCDAVEKLETNSEQGAIHKLSAFISEIDEQGFRLLVRIKDYDQLVFNGMSDRAENLQFLVDRNGPKACIMIPLAYPFSPYEEIQGASTILQKIDLSKGYQLKGLKPDACRDYLKESQRTFNDDDIKILHELSGGIPRILSILSGIVCNHPDTEIDWDQLKQEAIQDGGLCNLFQDHCKSFDNNKLVILEKLTRGGAEFDEREKGVLDTLVKFGVLRKEEDRYSFCSSIFKEWYREYYNETSLRSFPGNTPGGTS